MSIRILFGLTLMYSDNDLNVEYMLYFVSISISKDKNSCRSKICFEFIRNTERTLLFTPKHIISRLALRYILKSTDLINELLFNRARLSTWQKIVNEAEKNNIKNWSKTSTPVKNAQQTNRLSLKRTTIKIGKKIFYSNERKKENLTGRKRISISMIEQCIIY